MLSNQEIRIIEKGIKDKVEFHSWHGGKALGMTEVEFDFKNYMDLSRLHMYDKQKPDILTQLERVLRTEIDLLLNYYLGEEDEE